MGHADRHAEIKRNYEAFEGLLASLLPTKAGQFALLRGGELVDIFPKAIDALLEGNGRFSDGRFSVQRITDRPLDLGFLSYGSGERDTR